MSPLQVIQTLWPFSGPPERRTESQIDSDLDEEFAFHIELKTRQLMDEGQVHQAARTNALASFGDIERIRRRCRRIALEDRIMMQRIHLVITTLLALALALSIYMGVGRVARERDMAIQNRMIAEVAQHEAAQERERAAAVQNFLADLLVTTDPNQGASATSLRDLMEKASASVEEDFKDDPATQAELRRVIEEAQKNLKDDDDATLPGSAPNRTGFIYIDGAVTRNGLYGYPKYGELTLSRAVTAAGLERDANAIFVVTSLDPNRPGTTAVKYSDLRADPSLDRVLQPGDFVRVDALDADGRPIPPKSTTLPN